MKFHWLKEDAKHPKEIVGFENKILSIAAGSRHALALDIDGKAYSWGKNDYGQVFKKFWDEKKKG